MALKPTIYKFRISLSDLNRNHFDTLSLTVAQHPSETTERMMARVLAYCLNAQQNLVFTKGLSAVEEPDLWVRTLDNKISLWIDIGEPGFDRIKKATRLCPEVRIYSFNTKSDVWWDQGKTKLSKLEVSIFRFDWVGIQSLIPHVKRTMDFSITLTGDSAYVAMELGESEISWETLQEQ